MPNYLTPEGLQIPSLDEILALTGAEQRAAIDALLANAPDTVLGMLNAIDASHEREAWEAIQALYTAIDPGKAEGTLLESVSAITGTLKNPATPSTFKGSARMSVNLNAGATCPVGFRVAYTPDPSIVFVTVEAVTNGTAVADTFPIAAVCETTGPIPANAGTVTTILTPTAGVNSTTNPTDATLGALVENDEALRQRRERELRQAGSCTPPALESDLLALTDDAGIHPIRSVVILENKLWLTNHLGLPPHSFEAVIWDGPGQDAEDADVAGVILSDQPPGIQSRGSVVVLPGVVTPQGILPVAIRFSRATQVQIEIEVTIRYDATAYAGEDAVAEAMAVKAQATQTPANGGSGSGVVPYGRYLAAALGVAGVNRVTTIRMRADGGAWVVEDDISIAARSVAVLDSGDVTVVGTAGL